MLVNNSAPAQPGYARWLQLRAGAIRILRNGFMPGSVRIPAPHEVARFRATLGLAPAKPVVGTLMRFAREKDPDLWLATAARLAHARPDIQFVMAGYGALQERIAQQIEALGLRDRIVLPGPVADVGLVYATFDVFLLSSLVEGLPNALIEAQARVARSSRPMSAARRKHSSTV